MTRRDSDYDEDDEPTVPCPYCRREVLEDSPRCPYCENYISEEDAPAARKPWWVVVGVLLCLYAVYRWITSR
jgi:hypothetical protein